MSKFFFIFTLTLKNRNIKNHMSTLSLKPSIIKKNPDLKADTIENDDNYTDYSYISSRKTDLSEDVLNQLVKDIHSLSPDDHMQIYIALRKLQVPERIFSKGNKATHFDVRKLETNIQWKLYAFVKMCTENKQRDKVISEAAERHRLQRQKLDDKLESYGSNEPDISLNEDSDRTESARYEQMLRLNR